MSDATVERLAMMLGRLERLNDELVTSVCAHHGISPSEIRVLSMLASRSRPVRPSTISRWVVQTTGGLTATLRRLEADGRIARTNDPDDGRSKLVSLTDAGREFQAEVVEELTDRYHLALGDLGSDLDDAYDHVVELVGAFERLGNHSQSTAWARDRSPRP